MAANPGPTPGQPNFDACRLLLDEWKWKHQHCWTVLRQYGLAAVTVSIVPYVKPDLITDLGKPVVLFPALAWTLVLFASWLFAGEYIRCKAVETQYYLLLGVARPSDIGMICWRNTFIGQPIGLTTLYLFTLGGGVLSIVNAYVLNLLIQSRESTGPWRFLWPHFWMVTGSLIALHTAGFLFFRSRWNAARLAQIAPAATLPDIPPRQS
jgi:hypothetical protein